MAITAGSNLNSVPAPTKASLSTNYLDLASEAGKGWAQQYVPDLMDKEAEVFGNRTISGFLSQIGAEEPMTADQVVWSEQGRLHLSYKGHVINATQQEGNSNVAGGTLEIDMDIDENAITDSTVDHGIRVNDTLLIADANSTTQALVTAVVNEFISVALFNSGASGGTLTNAGFSTGSDNDKSITVLVYGSEFKKGDNYNGSTSRQANEPQFKSFQNKPIILKDYYEVSGSDVSRIGWIEVSSEGGASGYLWYLKAESDTRSRFTDYLEMSMLESIKTEPANSKVDAFISFFHCS